MESAFYLKFLLLGFSIMLFSCQSKFSDAALNLYIAQNVNTLKAKKRNSFDLKENELGAGGIILVEKLYYDVQKMSYYDKLAANGFIVTVIERQDTSEGRVLTVYRNTLLDKSLPYLLEENEDYFTLNVFDYADFEILNKRIDNDTVQFDIVVSKLDKNELFVVLSVEAKQKLEERISDTAKGLRVYSTNAGLKILN